MDLLHKGEPTFLQTHLAERVLGGVPVPDALPGTAVGLIHVGVSLVPVVLPPHRLLVAWTVLPLGQVGAARIRARTFRFSWHGSSPF